MSTTGQDSRVRSEAQLSRKRLVDRVKHKENRHKSKGQLERMEAEISQIRQSLEHITAQLGQVALLPRSMAPCVLQPRSPATITSQQWASYSNTQLLSTLPPSMPTRTQPATFSSIRLLDCRCGFKHSDHFDSLEQCSVTCLYQTNVAFPHSLQTTNNMPRNPPLPSMMLHSDGDNFVTSLITPFLRDMKAEGPVETLLGAYLFAYRLMRWQLNPGQATLLDVPEWLLPTPAQASNPHPVCIDFLPWPRLREFLCSNPEMNPMQSIKLYWDSVRLHLPSECRIFVHDNEGKISISKDFEIAALDLPNWRMGLPWAGVFPHLIPLVS